MASTATQTAKSEVPKNESEARQSTTPEYTRSAKMPAEDLAADRSGNIDPSNMGEDRNQQKIAQLAYSYWEARGTGKGSAEEDWFRAEAEIRGKPSA